jgi:DNA-binding transcriptional LysR family regulator
MEAKLDRLESMSILVSAVEAGSLSAAARRLGAPLATISRKVSELEGHLGTRLLIRSSRRLTLTDAGRCYVAACKCILDDVGEAERAAMGEYSVPKGDLTVTAPIVFGRLHILPVVTDFLEAYPEIDIRLTLADRLVNLLDDHVDLAVRIGELPDSSMMATRVGAIRRVTCGSPAYFAARGTPREPRDLVAHDCVTCEGLMSAKVWTFTKGKSDSPVAIRSRLTVSTAEAAIDAAIAGVGITRVLSYQIANARRTGTLDIVLEEFEPAPWPVSLVYRDQGLLPLKLRAFLDFTAPRLRARLPQTGI